jgi:dienelactone hydrolase
MIYYPAITDGENAAIDSVNGSYPIIAFGHGFMMQSSYYISLYRQLASHGFIVIAPQFTDTQHGELGKDLIYCLNHIKSLSSTPGNRFFGLADVKKLGVSGHSMGGGASLLATIYDTTITIAAPFAAAETTPSIISSINSTKSYIYLISAQNDGITPPATTQIPMYNNTPKNKGLLMIKGGNHTKFMDTGIWDWIDPNGYINRNNQIYLSQKYLTAAFKLFLYENREYWKYVFGDSVNADTSLILQKSVAQLPLYSFDLITESGTVANKNINIKWSSTSTLNPDEQIKYFVEFSLDSAFTSVYYLSNELADTSIVIDSLPAAEFFCRILSKTQGGIEKFSGHFIKLVLTGTVGVEDETPFLKSFHISDIYPNPFNQEFSVKIESDKTTDAKFEIFDVLSRRISSSENEIPKGLSNFSFDLSKYPSGIYFLLVRHSGEVSFHKLILQK